MGPKGKTRKNKKGDRTFKDAEEMGAWIQRNGGPARGKARLKKKGSDEIKESQVREKVLATGVQSTTVGHSQKEKKSLRKDQFSPMD